MAERKKIRLSLQEVQPGMAVAEPICLEGEKIAFLAEGALLTERILELLRLRGQDAVVVYVPAANDANFAMQTLFRETYQSLLGTLEGVFQQLRYGGVVEKESLDLLAEETMVVVHQPDIFSLLSMAGQGRESFLHHSLNVGLLCGLLAIWQSYDETMVRDAVTAGLLHDMGKSRVPEHILEKHDVLLAHEQHVMHCHPFHSYQLLLGVSVPDRVCRAALHHHERLDGSGYPEGLKGDDISPLAQLVAIADVYDAMVSPRPYREAHSPLEALEELLQGMFERFNPAICMKMADRLKDLLLGATVVLDDGREGVIRQFPHSLSPRPLIELPAGMYLDLDREPDLGLVAIHGLQGTWGSRGGVESGNC
nr:HD domain-containing phosphohydrolase [uncultured Anaeromusa sp.]